MTNEQQTAIRELVDRGGWAAVRNHPVLSKVWGEVKREQRQFEDNIREPV